MAFLTVYEGTPPAAGVNIAVDKYYPYVFLGHMPAGVGAAATLTFAGGRTQDLVDGNGNVVKVSRPGNINVTCVGAITLCVSDSMEEAYALGR